MRGIGFPHARQIIQITRDRVVVATGERSHEIVYAICSVAFEHAHPRVIAAWLRDHWSVENAVHWVRDVTFNEDRSTARTGTAPQVMASLRKHRAQPAPPDWRRQHSQPLRDQLPTIFDVDCLGCAESSSD